ncbi:MAG: NAD(P)-dependent alcohol dehydrogenase [Chloroflexota bacterium]
MKAIVYERYGPPEVLQLKEVEKPMPGEKQVLVKVHAASANAMDYRRFEKLSLLGRFMDERVTKAVNTILGADVAGTVEAVGSRVTEFKPGDDVFGVAPGAFAEYACNGASKFALKPVNVSFEEAAAVPVAAFTALQGLRDKGKIQSGQKVVIRGASGGVGTFAVQIAKSFETEVTAVCSTRNLEMARSIGADHVIDYTREDFTRTGQRYDLILAVNGYHPFLHYRRALTAGGTCVIAGGTIPQVLQAMLLGPLISGIGNRKIGFMGIATTPRDDLLAIRDLLETRKIVPVIDRQYPLNEVAEAFRYLVKDHARGKVVIAVA